MSMTTTFQLTAGYLNITSDDGAGGQSRDVFGPISVAASMGPGTGPNQVDRGWHDLRTLVNASINYTLSAPPVAGQAMGHVRRFLLRVLSPVGSGGTGTVGPATSAGWTNGLGGPIPLCPGAVIPMVWPDAGAPAVVAGSNDTITITAVGTLQFSLEIDGTSV